jgi:hypothetical protein
MQPTIPHIYISPLSLSYWHRFLVAAIKVGTKKGRRVESAASDTDSASRTGRVMERPEIRQAAGSDFEALACASRSRVTAFEIPSNVTQRVKDGQREGAASKVKDVPRAQ